MLTIDISNRKIKILYSIFIGIFHSITIFFHQSNLIFGIVIVFYMFFLDSSQSINDKDLNKIVIKNILLKKIKPLQNIKYILAYAITGIIIVSAAYYYVGIVKLGLTLDITKAEDFNNITDSTYFFNWLILYSKIDYWGKGYTEGSTFLKSIYGITTYFYQPMSINGSSITYNVKSLWTTIYALPNMLLFLFLTAISIFIIRIKDIWKKYSFKIAALLIFIIIYTVFSGWWEPDYREFWVSTAMSYWIFIIFIYNYIIDKIKYFKPIIVSTIYLYMAVIIILLFTFNFEGFLYNFHSNQFKQFDIIENRSPLRSYPITEIK